MKPLLSGALTGLALLTLLCGPAVYAAGADCSAAQPYMGPPAPALSITLPDARPLSPAFPEATRMALNDALARDRLAARAVAVTAAMETPLGYWQGQADAPDTTKAVPRFYWASAGKLLTAVVALQVFAEQQLPLDTPVARWFPALPNADHITLEQLLSHTAGLASANEDPAVRARGLDLSADDHVRLMQQYGALFCPGSNWRYSNSGYVLLGAIVEALAEQPLHELINRRIAARLQLTSLRAIAAGAPTPADVAPLKPADGQPPILHAAHARGAGNVVSDAGDMLRVLKALLEGELLAQDAVRAQFATLYPMFNQPMYYGRGVMVYRLPGGDAAVPVLWLGHGGGTPGGKAIVAYAPAEKSYVAVALTGDGPAEAIAFRLLQTATRP